MSKLVATMLIVVGIIHLLPVSGVVSAARLTKLYGLAFDEPNLQILMRHRAVLFGLLGALMIAAAAMPTLRPAALVGGWVSVASFLWLAWSVGDTNALIRRVVIADVIAAVCMAVATAAHFLTKAE